jgi:tetratricopeptide (TPR) repeat protein
MNIKLIRKLAGLLVFSVLIVSNIGGQELNDVIKVYNEGAAASKSDPAAAIAAFENVITLSDKVGDDAADLKQKAMKVLPGLYFRVAYNELNEKKPAPEVIRDSKKALAMAEKYGNETYVENSKKVLVQAYNTMAVGFFSQNEDEKAIQTFDSLLAINPDYTNAIFNKSLIYRKLNNTDAFEATVDLYLSKLDTLKEQDKIKQASSMALEYFRAAGSQEIQANNLDEAIGLLTKAEKYGEDKSLFYFLADAYNKKKDFSNGEEYAAKGLALETGDAEAKAMFYFQLGLAQAGKGETTEACSSFKNALYGAFEAAAKAERTNLKCQ